MDALKDYFRPEFLNRLDDIIIFDILNREAVAKIVEIQINQITQRLYQKEISLAISPEAMEFIAKEGYSPQYGARPLKRLIQTKILNPVASLILSKGVMKGGVVSIGFKSGEFTFDIKKGRKGSLIAENILTTDSVA